MNKLPNTNLPPGGEVQELPKSLDRELLTFLREENEATRASVRQEAQANRDALLGTLKIVAYPLTVVLAIAGFLGWRSLSDLKTAIRNEARQETKLEISRMQTEIRERLNTQFQTPELRKMVSEAAREQTGTVLHPLIVKEVSTDVAQSVGREQATIKAAVVVQAHQAVNDLRPMLDGIVQTRVNTTVDQAVESKIGKEVAPVLQELQNKERLSSLILNAQADDGPSFDQLVSRTVDPSEPPQERESLLAVARAIVQQHNAPIYGPRKFIDPKSESDLLKLLHGPDALVRRAALDSISLEMLKTNMSEFMQVMTGDKSLTVREAGFRRFAQIRNDPDPKHQIENLDNTAAMQWWLAHQGEFARKQ